MLARGGVSWVFGSAIDNRHPMLSQTMDGYDVMGHILYLLAGRLLVSNLWL